MPLFLACLLAVALCLVRSASAADVDTAPVSFVFGVRSPLPPGSLSQTVTSAVHDASGSVYVVESTRIQKFDHNGVLQTYWFCPGCSGIDVNQATGDLYVTSYESHVVFQYTANGELVRQFGGPGLGDGQLFGPHGIGVDPTTGEVYVFDTGHGRVQVFSATGVYQRKFGQTGLGAGDFSGSPSPGGLAVDSANQLVYVTDPRIHRLFKFTTSGTFITKWGDPSGSTPGHFRWPRSVELDGQGRVYVTDTDSERIQYFENDGTYIGQFQGPHNDAEGPFHPRDIAINQLTGEKYVNAAYANRQDKFDANNAFVLSFGGRLVDGPYFEAPHGIAISPTNGDLFIFDSGNFLLKRFSAGGAFLNQWGGSDRIEPGRPGLFGQGIQSGLAVGLNGRVWVGLLSIFYSDDVPGPWLQEFEPTGAVVSFLTRKPVTFNYEEIVRDLAIEPTTGDLFVSDGSFRKLRRLTATGVQIDELAVPDLAGITFVGGKLYVADPTFHVIRRYDQHLGLEATIGGPGGGDGKLFLRYASGVAVDANGSIFVADTGNHRISQFNADGSFRAKRGSFGSLPGQFVLPMDIALSPAGDLLYVVDTFNHRIQALCLTNVSSCNALIDPDGDGRPDAQDNCPAVSNASQANGDGDAFGDACDTCPLDITNDVDGDLVCGSVDNCPAVANASQANGDGDAQGDACDVCPNDAANDADGDGTCGDVDNCPVLANANQANADGDAFGDVCDACPNDAGNDGDGDALCGDVDNCPAIANADQTNGDGDALGDVCDTCPSDPANDGDGDALCGAADNCPIVANAGQEDGDGDGIGDACDNCEALANTDQTNADGDAHGDVCDSCPLEPGEDADADGFCGAVDNCPDVANPDQQNADADALGDVCDACPADPSNDVDGDGICGASDDCPFIADPGQEDSGGLGGPTPDGVGDACQCGDVASSGVIDAADLLAYRVFLAADPEATAFNAPAKCRVSGPAGACSILDVSVLARALDASGTLPPGISQACDAAGN